MKMAAAVVAVAAGGKVNVSEVCRQAVVSRPTFYKYVARVRAEGTDGLRPRSRRPRSFPRQVSPVVEDAIVRKRKELQDAGLDHGATTILWHLGRDDTIRSRVPSVATIHRVLVRRGLVFAQPEKRPKSSWRRFEAPAPNEWWQVDFFDWVIATGLVHVFNFLDDHSRVAARSRPVEHATTEEAWTTFCQACELWGMPAGVLSDNGLQFSGKLRGFEVYFEMKLREAGVRPFTGRAYHPQTTGKVERFQQTVKKWLRRYDHRHGIARDLTELQARLDEFCQVYNHERPHQGIGRVTPFSRWRASPKTLPSPTPLPAPARSTHGRFKVNRNGVIAIVGQDLVISVGVRWVGRDATVVIDPNDYATVIIDGELVRHFKLDRSRPFQPIGKRRGRGGGTPRQLRS